MKTISEQQFKSQYGENAVKQLANINASRMPQQRNKAKEFGKGFAKGVGDTVFESANLLVEGGRYIQAGVNPTKTIKDVQEEAKASGDSMPVWTNPFAGENEAFIRDSLKAKTGYEKAGKVAEFGAELASPFAYLKGARMTFRNAKIAEKVRDSMRFSARQADDITTPPRQRVGALLNKYRRQLSDIDPQYETILKEQPDSTKVMSYFDQAEKAALDPRAPMATTLASKRGVDAYDAISKGMDEAGAAKRELLEQISDVKIPGDITGNSIGSISTKVSERFGGIVDETGAITQAPNRVLSIDDKSQKLITEYVNGLQKLGPNPTARELDDFVDKAQRMLYRQSSPNLLEVADEPVVAFLKSETGRINSTLKSNVDSVLKARGLEPKYAAYNAEYSNLIDVQQRLNKALGEEGDKGASLMKSLFSPQTGERTRRLFQQIKDETGIDLFEEATLAKFAMESVGDVRSKSLLKQIDDAATDVSQIDFTKPGTWLNYVREKVDLDGKALAEQIIKESN